MDNDKYENIRRRPLSKKDLSWIRFVLFWISIGLIVGELTKHR